MEHGLIYENDAPVHGLLHEHEASQTRFAGQPFCGQVTC